MEAEKNVSPSEKAVVKDVLNRIKQVLDKKLTDGATKSLVAACTEQKVLDIHRRHRQAKTSQMANDYLLQWGAMVTAHLAEQVQFGSLDQEDYWLAQDRILVLSGAIVPDQKFTELTPDQRANGLAQMQAVLQHIQMWNRAKLGFRAVGAIIAGWGLLHLDVGGMVSGAVLGLSAPKLIDNRHELLHWVKSQGLKATKSEAAAVQAAMANLQGA